MWFWFGFSNCKEYYCENGWNCNGIFELYICIKSVLISWCWWIHCGFITGCLLFNEYSKEFGDDLRPLHFHQLGDKEEEIYGSELSSV